MGVKDAVYNVKKSVVSWAADIRFYKGGLILFGSSYYKLKGPHVRTIVTLVKPGDILLRKYDHYLGSRIIPGFWSHAAIYAGNNEVIHMLGDGITLEDILTFTRGDHMMILRHKDKDKADIAAFLARKYLEKKIEYDYNFDEKETNRMYCTEFVNVCYSEIVNPYISGTDIMPDDFLKVPELQKIWTDVESE